ncbi:MAG: diaminobutyrate--2-oxoglutarate transaminase [Smithellaceae bacterium]|jgi:diaminobutyrate-2-oxoglutarate transaminase|nr:diaminobutyrate--2-oxoglutarate transaminase [Syntrophaceae bacterium]MBP8608581.1 diaminobutyrate--2-oxoglutarate transaminase [Syntrophaceae bacterium]NMD06250.1 diaminobutyrate--2-oxoglutarate transaminase [Deltaproteobacteria bacterium]HQQ88443.1 diaminobutyrate--2-oxoglutarate transaminase [Smithellaceae bacterium]
MRIIEQIESQVRSYVRHFPTIFKSAKWATLYDEQGKEYIDFFAGAGTLNYGHNNPAVTTALIEYLRNDGIVHGLDMATTAKTSFLEKFYSTILSPRHMEYKVQFSGPTGTNAVETALKIARMVKGRSNIISFTNGFHGLTMGSMAVTGNAFYRDEAFINRTNVTFMPYDGYFGSGTNTALYIRKFIEDNSSGVDLPAAFILETVQAEGGINVASSEWLKEIEQICHDFDILLIVDDIQVGNGRTGTFFSFEEAGLNPDIIILSKSIGGGLPMAMVLMKPELDQWKPGEHTGTFRGNNLAFVASKELLSYWDNGDFTEAIRYRENILKEELSALAKKYSGLDCSVRGRGMIYGLHFPQQGFCGNVTAEAFERGLVIELSGANSDVIKFLPPLVIEEELLRRGINIIDESIQICLDKKEAMMKGAYCLDT